jgi:acyl-CoA reductase-like NAD-dependent aldehyde dehydrogenase
MAEHVVSQEQYDRVSGYLGHGRAEGGTVVTGGRVRPGKGYFVEPTVFTGPGLGYDPGDAVESLANVKNITVALTVAKSVTP